MKFSNRIKDIDRLLEEIKQYRPLDKYYLKQIKEYFRVGLTYSSNAIEGNTLSEVETKIILEDGLTIGGKTIKEHQEVVGHSEAYDLLYDIAKGDQIIEGHILDFHRLFFYRIDKDNAGKYRKVNIIVSGSKYTFPYHDKVPSLMESFLEKIPDMRSKYHPVEFVALLHKEFVEIHPFIDGNGRVARLLMNLSLMQDDYVITIIPPIMRQDYIQNLEISHGKDSKPFINFISNMVYESHKEYLNILKKLI